MCRVDYVKGNEIFPDIKVVYANNEPEQMLKDGLVSASDLEMDKRAAAAVQAELNKAKICKRPVAKYDHAARKAYIEYADGRRKDIG